MKANSRRIARAVIFCSISIGLILSGCTKRKIVNSDSKGETIVCFGDSITFGYGAKPGEDYPTALARMVGVQVINAGIDGDTSSEALERLKSDCLDRDPFLVIIEFGGNDFLRKTPIETTINNVRQMVEQVQARGAMVAIADISAGLFLKDYRSAYKKLAYEKGAIFVPSVLSKIVTNPSMKSDFLHPNGAGYRMIARRIYRAIEPYLDSKTLLSKK